MMNRYSPVLPAWLRGSALAGLLLAANPAGAQIPGDSVRIIPLDTLRAAGRVDDLLGLATSASEGRVGALDLNARPLTREGELLETVPGVIVTQHSGEGKANQYFVRGFNLDHGTDFQTRVEGMPVNMPTHGHGQGYTDLNFLIPEFVDLLDYRLGVYHPEVGDFGSAGAAEFHLKRSVSRPFVALTGGSWSLARVVAGASAAAGAGTLLLGGEGRLYDGPWTQPQEIEKLNGILRYTRDTETSRSSILALGYTNRWNATDQIPLRAVEAGTLDRFGQIDPTDGGTSSRFSLSGSRSNFGPNSSRHLEFFAIRSTLDLFSNFSYFLGDADNGDQFEQVDRRTILGLNLRESRSVVTGSLRHELTGGVQVRLDLIDDVGLHLAKQGVRTETVRQDEVQESAAGVFLQSTSYWTPFFRTVVGVRADGFHFDVASDRPENSGDRRAGIVSPKLSLILALPATVELYGSAGMGFHSNDARGTTITVDPATGDPAYPVDPLVRSRGAEIGMRSAPVEGLRSTLALWGLELDSELLFVGDAGATEPTDASRRWGATWANFYRPFGALSLDADFSLARARLLEVDPTEDRIPGALESVFAGGIAWTPAAGIFAGARVRHFGEYPLIEDNSVRAEASTLVNLLAGYQFPSGVNLEVSLLNVFDAEEADIQYFYESRLPGEPEAGVADIHFHPVEPRQLRASLQWVF